MAVQTQNPNKIAEQQDRERSQLELMGIRAARSLGRRLRAAAVGAFNRGDDLMQAINPVLQDITDLLVGNMTAAHLVGRRQAIISAGTVLGTRSLAFAAKDAYAGAVKFVQDRLVLSDLDILIISQSYSAEAVTITRNLGGVVERAAQDAVEVMVERGAHTREGMGILRTQLDTAGLTNVQPYLLETIARTQTQLAYGAGRWNVNQDPAIDEILWGYEYVTVGDDRVRPNHEALHGTRYPKDDPMLQEIWPPNGFNCRCTMVEIYFEGTPNRPAETEVIEGIEVVPGADAGWDFNPGTVHADGLRLRGQDFKP